MNNFFSSGLAVSFVCCCWWKLQLIRNHFFLLVLWIGYGFQGATRLLKSDWEELTDRRRGTQPEVPNWTITQSDWDAATAFLSLSLSHLLFLGTFTFYASELASWLYSSIWQPEVPNWTITQSDWDAATASLSLSLSHSLFWDFHFLCIRTGELVI